MDLEFLEGTQDKRCLGIKYGQTKPTIDMISIGLVSEDNREYYAVSKDFNLKEAWNRYDLVDNTNSVAYRIGCEDKVKKVYWIRDNVLKPIYEELFLKYISEFGIEASYKLVNLSYSSLRKLLKMYGKSNIQIANEVCEFIYGGGDDLLGLSSLQLAQKYYITDKNKEPKFYTYYGAYDHVVFCWLFGKMIDLPKGFPMYSIDLKQELDNIASTDKHVKFQQALENLKNSDLYPKQNNEHNALADARWNRELHEFIERMKKIENRVNSGTITYKAFKKSKRSTSR